MEPVTASSFLPLLKALCQRVWTHGRRWKAEESAAEAPEKHKSIEQEVFAEVLGRISAADSEDSLFKRASNAVANRFFTVAHLRSRNVQDWLAEPGVQQDLRRVAGDLMFGRSKSVDAVGRLEARYEAIACATAQEAVPVVASVSAMLAAGVQARVDGSGLATVMISGVRATAEQIEELSAKVDSLLTLRQAPISVPVSQLPSIKDAMETEWRAAFADASRGLLHWRSTLATGEHLDRPELRELLQLTTAGLKGAVAVLGIPGSGKSALLATLGKVLVAEQGVAVLGIKGDLLGPGVASEEDLQKDLSLPELPSVMLRRLAARGPAVLLVDQLDALAGHLDTRTGRLSALLNLIKSVSNVEGLHIVVSCRTFEYAHDIRLSQIQAQSVTLELPAWNQVLRVLESQGIEAAGWNSDAREVVRVPQHLNIFLRLRASSIAEPFSNYTAMLDSLWSTRILKSAGGGAAADLACAIADRMADKEILWLAGSRFESSTRELELLEASGMIVRSPQGAIAFAHQTIFEHVLARSLVKTDGRLSAYVLARSESLFIRPKAWAALAYLRGVEPETYEAELSTIWSAQGLRKHVRFLLIEFMGSQPSPTAKEVLFLSTAAENPELRPLVLKAITGEGWFREFGATLIRASMADKMASDLCVRLLIEAWSYSEGAVIKLLEEVWLPNGTNDWRTLLVLQEAAGWSPDLVRIAMEIAGRCELSLMHIDHFVAVVGGVDPDVAIDLFRAFLDNELSRRRGQATEPQAPSETERPIEGEVAETASHRKLSPKRLIEELLDDRQHSNASTALASASPSHFLAVLWPWFARAFWVLSEFAGEEPYLGYPLQFALDFRFEAENPSKLPRPPMLDAITLALELLSMEAPEEALTWADAQRNIDLAPVQRLVAHTLAHNPARLAHHALEFLLEDERRYLLGNVSDASSTTIALVAACSPYWAPDEITRYAEKINSFAPPRPPEQDSRDDIKHWTRYVLKKRFELLRALAPPARSTDIQKQIDEGDRAFRPSAIPSEFLGGWIGSPMDADQFAQASNDQILNAFRMIPDKSGWDHPVHFARGGNVQLGRAFAEFAARNPTRAYQIIQSFEPYFGQRAAGYAIDALAKDGGSQELVDAAIALYGRGFDDEEYVDSIARALDQLVNRDVDIPEELLTMLEERVFRAGAVSESPQTVAPSGRKADREPTFLLCGHQGIELVPGGDYPVISAIVRARVARNEPYAAIQLLQRYLEKSQNAKIWEGLALHMADLPRLDVRHGPPLIGQVLSLDQLDGTRGAAFLMASAQWYALDQVMTNLARWRSSESGTAQCGYGEVVALIAVINPNGAQARQWLNELIDNPDFTEARVGATAAAVQLLWRELQFRGAATDLILRLLSKHEPAVWMQVFGFFLIIDRLEPEEHTVRLLQAMAAQIEFAPAPEEPYVVERLGTLLPHHALLIARIASHLIQLWRDQLGSAGSALVMAAPAIMELAITLHRTEGTKSEGLQMFEQLIEIDAYQSREILDEIDHRLRPGAAPRRTRLRRQPRSPAVPLEPYPRASQQILTTRRRRD